MTETLVGSKVEILPNGKPKKDRAMAVLLLYLAFEYLRIQDAILPFLAPLKIPMFLTLALLVIVLKRKKFLPLNVLVISMSVFVIEMLCWIPFATNNYFAFQTAKSMTMLFVTVLGLIVIVDTKEKALVLCRFWVVIVLLLSIWVITHGGSGPGGFVRDENDACLVVASAIPFAWYLYFHDSTSKKLSILYGGSFVVFLAGVVFTSSRGGLLGLAAAVGCIVWLSKRRWRNILLLLVLSLAAGSVMLSVLPDEYVKDMKTISNKDDGTRNLRLLHWTTAWEVFKANPVFGVGPNNYPWVSHHYFHLSPYYNWDKRNRAGRQSHSLYFTLIPEMGALGIGLFLLITYKILKRLYARRYINDGLLKYQYPMLFSSIVSVLISGAFITVLYYPVLWHMFAFAVIFLRLEAVEDA